MHSYSLYICNKIILVKSDCGRFLKYCRGYIIKEPAPEPDYVITITNKEVEAQKDISGTCNSALLEGFVLLRKLEELLLKNERTLFMHGSVVAYMDSAYMFTAESGVGKTTHSLLWRENLPGTYILNGDKPFISTQNDIIAWGSPWCGAEGLNTNRGVELKAICLMKRADNNSISEISFEEALPMLGRQSGNPDPSQYIFNLYIIEALYKLKERVKFFDFRFNNFKSDAFLTSYQALTNE